MRCWPNGIHGHQEIYPHSYTPLFILVKSDQKVEQVVKAIKNVG